MFSLHDSIKKDVKSLKERNLQNLNIEKYGNIMTTD